MSRIAIENFLSRFVKGQWTALGFSLFFFALSLATSGVSVWKIATFSNRRDVALSHDSSISTSEKSCFMQSSKDSEDFISNPFDRQAQVNNHVDFRK